ncbi:glycolate oxidase iron-sulfur subunit [Lysobacter xinjiangensis]|uniref:Glycolate oxidase iron-sulfur subunit n=1 Tax=Cognatilysobacter xinjiangensis TaxID=546892 RepID=A0ABQ3C6Y6_9GAMM|nr:(Fe-S)-binding protein [Lysobacter xinjiangensis]GGZ70687.1 glycolate oxidase iron-sulfur subunit [Lysobacter xinjiangensis]
MPLPRPPAANRLVGLADQCVQCGLCLPACPTYRRDRIEAESPRGRIALARGWALDALEPTPVGDAHLDHCLACRACEAVCPAGVRYGALLLETRSRQRRRRGAAAVQCAIEWLTARPRGLTRLLSLYRWSYRWLPRRLRVLPRPPAAQGGPISREHAVGPRSQAALFVGCAAQTYEAPVRASLARLLSTCGIDMSIPAAQTCCGALHAHAGGTAIAASLAATNRDAFAGHAQVLTLASGCHEAVAAAMPDGTATVDALDVLDRHADALAFRSFAGRVALHLPCTQRNVVGSVPALRRLLARVPGLDLIILDAGYGCCGASGSAMLLDRERAASFRDPLLYQLDASGATLLLSANIGCRLHLQSGTAVPVLHPVEFLARQLDGSFPPAQ